MPRAREEPDSDEDPDLDDADWNPEAPLLPCPECGRDVSEESDRCPYCGQYISPGNDARAQPIWLKIGIAFVIGMMIWAMIAWW